MREWYCPQCTSRARTFNAKIPMHPCRGLAGLMAPLIDVETRGESKAVERQDYIGSDNVQFDSEGRPKMAVITSRDDGQDCTIFAPCAAMGVKAIGLD